MKKRLLSLCTALLLLLTLLPAALPAEAATYENLTYTISNGQVAITDCDDSATGHITIPAAIEGYPVTAIEMEAFQYNDITGVTIPDTVTSIGVYAFMDCSKLTSVTIPASVASIGLDAFSGCTSLTGIWVSEANPYFSNDDWGVLFNKDKTKLIRAPGNLDGSYTIPSSVTTIAPSAFSYCAGFSRIVFPDSITSIGAHAFHGCSNITHASIPENVTIGEGAFKSCTNLMSVTIPDSIISMGGEVFKSCSNLLYTIYEDGKYLGNASNPYVALVGVTSKSIPSITFHPQTKIIAGFVFQGCDLLNNVTIPEGITNIGPGAFYSCDNLSSITIPNSVTGIGYRAFEYCIALTGITLPGSVTGIEHGTFTKCTSLTSIKIPDGVTSISYEAFLYCSNLAEVTIPGSVTSIDYWAFKNCPNLKTINFTGNAPTFGGEVFIGIKATLRYHAGATGWNKVNSAYLTGNASNITFQTVDHFFENGSCSYCGAGDPSYLTPPVLKLSHPSLTFEDVITMNVYFSATNLENVVEMGLITYGSQVADYNVGNAEAVIPGYRLNANGLYSVVSNGIAAKDMGDTMWFAVYAKLTDGSYVYTKLVSYSPKTYAYSMLTKGTEATKKLCVALLNYGAAAQTYFSYNTGSLMNSDLTADHNAMIESYRSDMMTASVAPDAAKAGNFINNGGYTRRYPSIVFEGAFSISYNFIPSAAPVGDITMYVWDQAAFDAAEVLTRENATKAIAMTPGDTYTAVVDGIAAKDLDKGVYVTFCYSDGTTEYCSGILNYSIGDYCTGKAADTTAMAPLAAATAVYGYYAKQMFYA